MESGMPTTGPVEEIADFLVGFPPFDRLSRDDLLRVAEAVTGRSYSAATDILIEDGSPATELFIIRSGSVELRHQDEVVDILEPGESFGHPSLLTGMAAAFTVRAHKDTTCYIIEREAALDVLGRPAGAIFVARTMRERLIRTGHTVHGLPEVRTIRIGNLISGPPVLCRPERTIREAANLMSAEHVSALFVSTSGELGIVTDTDFREKVVAGGVSPEAPITTIMSRPLLAARVDRYAADAALDMLYAGVEHLAVTDARGKVVGVVSAGDLMGLAYWSPFALRAAIFNAPTEAALDAATKELPGMFAALVQAGLSASDIGRVLALSCDAVTIRLLDFAIARHGPAPRAWAWLALGSVARRELTLASDQDNALAYADDGGAEADAFFARFAADINDGLARSGLGADQAEVLARDPRWRMSQSAWKAVFEACLEHPDRSHLVRPAVSFDFRDVGGGLDIVPPLAAVVRDARLDADLIARLARTATDWKVELGRRGRVETDRDGRIDLKIGGALPIANLARFHALSAGITISGTVDRLVAAQETGSLDAETATALREAFETVSRIRLEHHAACLAHGRPADNRVDPQALPPLRRAGLREALRAVAAAQRRLGVYARPGM